MSEPYTANRPTSPPCSALSQLLTLLGPGFLFADAAIGTSHVVQATRAGTEYGTGLLVFVLLALLVQYPCFYFGPLYASTTGNSLVEGYRQTFGKAVVAVFGLIQIPMFAIIIAAIAITAAGVGGNFWLGIALAAALRILTVTSTPHAIFYKPAPSYWPVLAVEVIPRDTRKLTPVKLV